MHVKNCLILPAKQSLLCNDTLSVFLNELLIAPTPFVITRYVHEKTKNLAMLSMIPSGGALLSANEPRYDRKWRNSETSVKLTSDNGLHFLGKSRRINLLTEASRSSGINMGVSPVGTFLLLPFQDQVQISCSIKLRHTVCIWSAG